MTRNLDDRRTLDNLTRIVTIAAELPEGDRDDYWFELDVLIDNINELEQEAAWMLATSMYWERTDQLNDVHRYDDDLDDVCDIDIRTFADWPKYLTRI